jgi:hypothetical protein
MCVLMCCGEVLLLPHCIPFFLNGMTHNSLGCLRNEKKNTLCIRETIEQYTILLVTC